MIRLGQGHNAWLVSRQEADLSRQGSSPRVVRFAAQPQNVTVDLAKSAVVVIDMQNDFCCKGGWLDSIGVDVTPLQQPIGPLSALLPMARSQHVPILWVNWGNRPDKLNLSPSLLHVYNPFGDGCGIGDVLPNGSAVLQKGSWGAAIVDQLLVDANDIFVDKFRISGFWDTPLDSILRTLGITTLFFCGVNVDQCVLATLQDANFLGYDCILLEDCVATTSPSYCFDATIYNVKQCYGFVSYADAVVDAMRTSTAAKERVLP